MLPKFGGDSSDRQVNMEKGFNVHVFAYGSNMCTQRMRSRVPSAKPVTIGYVCERRFVLHKRSDDGSAKADAAFTAVSTDRVWGVVYRLHREDASMIFISNLGRKDEGDERGRF